MTFDFWWGLGGHPLSPPGQNSKIGDRAIVRMLASYTRVKFHEDPFRIDGALGFFQRASQEEEEQQ